MNVFSPSTAGHLADALLGLHLGIVIFNVLMPPWILLGAWRGWPLIRRHWLRLLHLGGMAVVAIQAVLGDLCFLTLWESALRERAGQAGYGESFVEAWLGALLYVDLPLEQLVTAYLLWAALSLALWWLVPPARRARRSSAPIA